MKMTYMRDVCVAHGVGADLLDFQNPRIHFLSDSDNEDDTDRDVRPPPTKRRKLCISSNIPSILMIALPEARFSSERTNIHIRMQKLHIPTGEYIDPWLIPQPSPTINTFILDRDDVRYLRLFLERGQVMVKPLGLFFPRACENILRTSMENPRLTHAIIAITMHYSETALLRTGSASRLNRYLESFSPKAKSDLTIRGTRASLQEGEIYAIFLVLTLTVMRLSITNDIESLRRYVTRLYELFREAQADVDAKKREPLSPLLLWVWRQTMGINITFALGVDHIPALFPPPAYYVQGRPAQGHGPIKQFLGTASEEFEKWTLAQLELDDLGNRIFRLHLRANSIRNTETNNCPTASKGSKIYLKKYGHTELKLNSQRLATEIAKWKQKPVIQVAEYMEQVHRQQPFPASVVENKFLHYPALRFKNPLYACLLLTHCAMTISLSLIVEPRVGPRLVERVEAAVEICRIYAALGGNHPVGSLTCLASVWWAGLTFEPHTEGRKPIPTFRDVK